MKSMYLLLALAIPHWLPAQTREAAKEAEQIIITKKTADNQILNIVVDGDNVTVNGKPVSGDKDAAISVKRKKIKDLENLSEWSMVPGSSTLMGNALVTPAMPNKAMLGVTTRKADAGVEVVHITEESAAAKAGLKPGDLITSIDRNTIATPDDLSKAIKDKAPGSRVTVTYIRDKKQYTAVAELTKWTMPQSLASRFFDTPYFDADSLGIAFPKNFEGYPSLPGNSYRQFFSTPIYSGPKLGIKIQDLPTEKGVTVIEVQPNSEAEKAGLKEGDIIKEVNNITVLSTETLTRMMSVARAKPAMKFTIERNGRRQNIEVIFTKKIKTADL